jgi:hypothetical protein
MTARDVSPLKRRCRMQNRTTGLSVLAVVLLGVAPRMVGADDPHDDVSYTEYGTAPAPLPVEVAGPGPYGHDDAPYPDVADDERQPRGISVPFSGGPAPYGHDDATYTEQAARSTSSRATGDGPVAIFGR